MNVFRKEFKFIIGLLVLSPVLIKNLNNLIFPLTKLKIFTILR